MTGRCLAILMLTMGPLACGSPDLAGAGKAPTTGSGLIGPVDLAAAPSTLTMTCGGGVTVALEMPCLIGLDLDGQKDPSAGDHETECRLQSSDQPVVWSFVLPLANVRANPGTPLDLSDLPPGTTGLAGGPLTVSRVTGDLSFSRVDPTTRAFAGTFDGSAIWVDATGAQTSCVADGPFWGAPGSFL